MKILRIISLISFILFLHACSVASGIQRADQSTSEFSDAFYDGKETVIRDDISDEQAFRIFHQGATGFVPVTSVRGSAERRAKEFCKEQNKMYTLLREHVSTGVHAVGNFPRAELIFACVDDVNHSRNSQDSSTTKPIYEHLKEIKSLLDEGIITEDEFNMLKKKILENS